VIRLRAARCHHFARKQQVAYAFVLRRPDAPAQLIQSAEAKLVPGRSIDDGICIWDVEAAFDKRGANEHVDFPGNESRHNAFQFVGITIWPCPISTLACGQRSTHPIRIRSISLRDCAEEYLTLPFSIRDQSPPNQPLIVSRHHCFYRQAVEGGVSIVDISFTPTSESRECAESGWPRASATSTSLKSSLNFSLCSTPKRAPHRSTTSARSLNTTRPR